MPLTAELFMMKSLLSFLKSARRDSMVDQLVNSEHTRASFLLPLSVLDPLIQEYHVVSFLLCIAVYMVNCLRAGRETN
jgi:hypothetical protein